MRVLGDKPQNALALYIHRTGPDVTRDEDSCVSYLQNRPSNIQLSEEQVSMALTYTAISQTPPHNPSILVAGLRRVLPAAFRWQDVVAYLDQRGARVSPAQFLRLYRALLPLAEEGGPGALDIQHLWGGNWENPETQLSFICAFTSLAPDQLDATTIPGLQPTFTLDEYAETPPAIRDRAAEAVKHPLVSLAAISAIFHVALHSMHASTNVEAKRLFQEVVVPNIDIFVVSAFSVPKPWSQMATDTLHSLFDNFLFKKSPYYEFVLDSLWRKDKTWVTQRLIETHASSLMELPIIFEHALHHGWLNELIYLPNGFGLDLTAYAHAQDYVDLAEWAKNIAERGIDIARPLLQFLVIKASLEIQMQGRPDAGPVPVQAAKNSVSLRIRTVSALLNILEDFLPTSSPIPELIMLQRQCITAYPRLINYGEGYDDIIEANGKDGHAMPATANNKMEEHFKKMYGNEIEVRTVVEALEHYKHSRDPLDQDIFVCMIHSLFDEYNHFADYPLEALATTAVLFGGIIRHKLISDLSLTIGLGMILEAVRDHSVDQPMFKFGLQALMQLFPRLREWPGFCVSLLKVDGLRGTEAYKKADEVVRDNEEEMAGARGGAAAPGKLNGPNAAGVPGDPMTNGNVDDIMPSDQRPAPFTAINVEPLPPGHSYEDPNGDTQGKIQFALNNTTETTLHTMFMELQPLIEEKYQQWFASHLVEQRAKMQPNYHGVYLDLVNLFQDKGLWADILRETYVSVARMLNAEATMQNSTERTHLKNLGGWLGLLTLARDKPIKHKNIAFKQLLIEAHDTKRLIVVIPFVCKVLIQGSRSNIFRPPNPWLMDIIHFLIELYHNAELKLNLKFEIEVLCKGLNLDHKSIEPSGEILNRVLPVDESAADLAGGPEGLESFENMSLNGLGPGGGVSSSLSPHAAPPPPIPDIGPHLQLPQVSEMVVSSTRLHEIVRNALTRALQDIIQPVVDRSVAIAAIATQQMIRKDFATEIDENRIRTSAINMVKSTAGSLAQVTSKEPLRANFSNYMRAMASDLPQGGLPEGTILLCVNSNLDVASGIIEKATEERAVPEIEELLEGELDARRRHRIQRPNEPYVDRDLSRWAMTIPAPYKLQPSMSGLNPEQMAIYEDFARHPRPAAASAAAPAGGAPSSHVPSASDATRSLANEVLQEQYSSVPSAPTPAETPSAVATNVTAAAQQMQQYSHLHGGGAAGMVNGGRQAGGSMDGRVVAERIQKLVVEFQRAVAEASELQHFSDLPRSHPVIDVIDALVQIIIKTQQTSEDFAMFAAEQMCQLLFSGMENNLGYEAGVHIIETLRKIAGPALSHRVSQIFQQQPIAHLLNLALISALLGTDLLDWRSIDKAVASALKLRKDGSLAFFLSLLEMTLLNDSPVTLYADFAHSLEEAWFWVDEQPDNPTCQQFKAKVMGSVAAQPSSLAGRQEGLTPGRRDQLDYIFDEWVQLCNNPNASDKLASHFVEQMHAQRVIASRDDFFVFMRLAIDKSVDKFELQLQAGGSMTDGYMAIDAATRLVTIFARDISASAPSSPTPRASFLDSVLALGVILLNHHHVKRGEHFNQKVFFRFFSMLLHGISGISDELSDADKHEILLRFAARFNDLGPSLFPGFVYAWLALIQHRVFLPSMLRMTGNAGWAPLTKILKQLLEFAGEQLKPVEVTNFAKDIYRSTLKLLVILQHDFPDYLAANHVQLCESIPPHCTQFINMILMASPASVAKMPDPTQPGLRIDRMEEARDVPRAAADPAGQLARIGLLGILEQALQAGPTEDVVAHITRAINTPETAADGRQQTTFGGVPIATNVAVIDAIVLHIGNHAAARVQSGGPAFAAGGSDFATLTMVLHELPPEGRYFLLSGMINQLRFMNVNTNFYNQAVLEIFGHDMADPEEMEIREQICRILFERVVGYWPTPWGLMVTVTELIKNDKYMFFDLPFLKAAPEVCCIPSLPSFPSPPALR